jgi:F-type H+-transporting ATPase subunit delta
LTELKVSRKYARAVLELARDNGALEPTGRELADLAEVLRASPEARDFLSNALQEDETKRQFLESLMDRLGTGEMVRRLARLLLTRGRVRLLPEIADQYGEMADEHLGVVRAEIDSARPMDEEARRRLSESLERYTGKRVRLEEQVKPELIAGFRIRIGSLLIDGTLERQLGELNRTILG